MKHLINVEEFEKLKENSIIFDCRFALGDNSYAKTAYEKEHIPNAYFIDLNKDLCKEVGKHGGFHPLKDDKDIKELLESYGVDDNKNIIIYDEGDINGASRMLFQVLRLGLKNVYVLDGGLNEYKKEHFVTSEIPKKPQNRGNIKINLKDNCVDINEVKELKDKDSVVLIDSRSYQRYKGNEEPVYEKSGHIPSAINMDAKEVLKNGKFKDPNVIKSF